MNEAQWLPIQAVEGLVWRRGTFYVDKHKTAYRMDENGDFPSLYRDIEENGKYEIDESPGTEYYVSDPLKAFEALASAGKGYGFRIYKPQYNRDAVLIAKKGRSDIRLYKFIRDYGLPIDATNFSSPISIGYVHHPLSGMGQSDIGRGQIGEDLRTTAAIAHLCWNLWEGLRVLEDGDKPAKSKTIKQLNANLHAIDTESLDLSFYESKQLSSTNKVTNNLWTFMPSFEIKDASCHWATFVSSNATEEEILLRQGIYTTIFKVAQWYLLTMQLVLAPLDGDASIPRMVVRLKGLRSYLWMHFLHAVVGRGVPKFYSVQCKQDEGANGCGRWFYAESSKAGQCPECQTIINRVEQRIKRDRSLRGQKQQLIEEERRKMQQS